MVLHFLWILLRTFFVDVIGEGLLDCETIFVKFTILEFKGNLGYRSMRCLISVSWTYNFKYFCPVISDSLKSDRLRYLAWKSFYKIFRTFRAKGGRRKLNILQSEISFQSKNANTSVILQFIEGKHSCINNSSLRSHRCHNHHHSLSFPLSSSSYAKHSNVLWCLYRIFQLG